jgi:hypothetical protein
MEETKLYFELWQLVFMFLGIVVALVVFWILGYLKGLRDGRAQYNDR